MPITVADVTTAVRKTEDVITFSATGKTTYTLYSDVTTGTGFVDIGDPNAAKLPNNESSLLHS